jgi:hypothetical protein
VLSYRLSARSTVAFVGDGFAVRREAKALVGVNGYRAGAEYQYQFDRRSSVGIGYSATHFDFPRAFGSSDMQQIQLQFKRQLNRSLIFQFAGGAYRVETLGSQAVPLSPEVAAILGVSTGIQAIYRVNWLSTGQISLNYKYSNRTACVISGQQGSSPGNGLYLTSQQTSGSGGCSFVATRKATASFSAGYTRYTSIFQTLNKYSSFQGGGGLNYMLTNHINFTSQIDWRNYSVTQGSARNGFVATLGIAYTSSGSPIPRW